MEKNEENYAMNHTSVNQCGLSEIEFTEREHLLELQRSTTRFFSQEEFDRLNELSNKMFTKETSTYWVVEGLLNGQIIYWTGNIPHLSIQQSEEGLLMWTPNIHDAKKMCTELDAIRANDEFELSGEVTEHIDITSNL